LLLQVSTGRPAHKASLVAGRRCGQGVEKQVGQTKAREIFRPWRWRYQMSRSAATPRRIASRLRLSLIGGFAANEP